MNADEIIRRFAPDLARSLNLPADAEEWGYPKTGEIRVLGEDLKLLHTWRSVWMQDKRERYAWRVRVLEELVWEPTEDVEVHVIEIQHPDIPIPIQANLPYSPLIIERGGHLKVNIGND